MVYPALLPLLPLMRTPRLPVVDWTDAPTDLNGLVCFSERRNLVSTRVPSRFNWPPTPGHRSRYSDSLRTVRSGIQTPMRTRDFLFSTPFKTSYGAQIKNTHSSGSRLQLKCDGTRRRTGGEVKGKLANGVGSQYPSHYLETWCIQ